MKGKSTKIIY